MQWLTCVLVWRGLILVDSSRACLAVRFTAKNGDPPGAGKIWENWFYTGKMGPRGPENAQIDTSTCQGPRGTCQNFFSFTIQAAATTFPEVILRFAARGPKFTWICSVQLISYFSLIFFNISPPPPLQCTTLTGTAGMFFLFKVYIFST